MMNATGNPQVSYYSSPVLAGTTRLQVNQWFVLAATQNPVTLQLTLYLDGAVEAVAQNISNLNVGNALIIGVDPNGTYPNRGYMAHAFYYGRCLDGNEVAALSKNLLTRVNGLT